MRHNKSHLLTVIIGALAFFAARAPAQVTSAGDLDPTGRVLAKVQVTITDVGGFPHPVSGLRILVVAENGDRVSIRTDDAGIATIFVRAGIYQFTTPDALTVAGGAYSWDVTIPIQPGTKAIRFSETNARKSVPAPEAARDSLARVVPSSEPANSRLRVFVDCQGAGCDPDYFRTEIPFVDYMRDRADASLHILVTSQATGGGGHVYTVNFIGLRELGGASDSLRFTAPQSATNDDKRKGLARTIKLGLIRYVARTPAGERLQISYAPAAASFPSTAATARDPWNLWVFGMNASGSFSGEESQHFTSLRGSASANRTSQQWKFRLGVHGGYDESKFIFSDGSQAANYSHSYGATHLLVKSLGPHLSAGEKASLISSTFLNQKLFLRFAPAIEYDVFPYTESSRRFFGFQYAVGVNSFQYSDTTIFNKLSEVRPDQSVSTSLKFKQPWGSVSLSAEAAAYLDDFSQHRAVFYNEFDLRLFKGFSVYSYAGLSLVHDQLYLAKGTLSDEDILLRRRQLASTFSYYAGIGLSYTFGSIFNNVVNPRFEGPGGSF